MILMYLISLIYNNIRDASNPHGWHILAPELLPKRHELLQKRSELLQKRKNLLFITEFGNS